MKIKKTLIIGFLILLVSITGCVEEQPGETVRLVDKVTIADAKSLVAAHVYVALENGYFEEEGLDVTLDQTYTHGRDMINGVLDGRADFATGSETPFMHSGLNNENIYIIATTVKPQKNIVLVARKEKIKTFDDLKEKKIGVTFGSNAEFLLDLLLQLNEMEKEDVELVNLRPGQMVESLTNDDVDAIISWYPHWQNAKDALGSEVTIFSEDRYTPHFVLGARKDFVNNNPDLIKKFLNAIKKSDNFIDNDLDEAASIFSKYMGTEKEFLGDLDEQYVFYLSLKQSLILILEDQARWAIKTI
jgi:NitT/TauT family transport system substrate-binding protein